MFLANQPCWKQSWSRVPWWLSIRASSTAGCGALLLRGASHGLLQAEETHPCKPHPSFRLSSSQL